MMDERLRFVSRLLYREAMIDVCREFGISRKLVGLTAALENGRRRAARFSKYRCIDS